MCRCISGRQSVPRLVHLGAVAVLMTSVLGCAVAPAGSSERTSPAATAAVATPSSRASPSGIQEALVGGELPPGTYRSVAFTTPVQFTVPAGWQVAEDYPAFFNLASTDVDACICFARNVAAAAEDGSKGPQPGVGKSAKAIAGWLASHDGIQRTQAKPVTVGGLKGYLVDLVMNPNWTTTYPGRSEPSVPAVVGTASATLNSADLAWDVSAAGSRFYLLDLGKDGANGNVIINADAGRTTLKEWLPRAEPIIGSFQFNP